MGLVFPRRRKNGLTPQDLDEKLLRSVENARLRLGSVGVQEPQRRPNLLTSALDLLSRPNYAVAGLSRELINPGERFEPGREFVRGLTGERRYTFKDVAKAAGISDKPFFRAQFRVPVVGWNVKVAPSPAGIAGLAGDIFLDPTTYITFGGLGAAKQVSRFGKLRPALKVAREAGTVGEAIAAKQPQVAAQLQRLVDLRAAAKAGRQSRKALFKEAAEKAAAARGIRRIPEVVLEQRGAMKKAILARKAASDPGGLKFMGQTVIPGKAIKAGLEVTGVLPATRWAGRLPAVTTLREHVARIFDPAYHFRKAGESIQGARQLGQLEGRALTQDDVTRMVRGMIDDFGRRGALAGFEKEEADRFIKAAFAPLGSVDREQLRNLFEGAWRGKVPEDVATRVDDLRQKLAEQVTQAMDQAGEAVDEAQALTFDYRLYRKSPEYRELFGEYRRSLVEAMGHAAGSDTLKTAVKNVADLQDRILGSELEEGLLTTAVADYFPHVRDPHVALTAEQREKLAIKYGRDLVEALTTGTPEEQMARVAKLLNPHARERGLQGTIQEINQLVGRELFVEDPALALTVRAHRSIEARHAKAFLASVCQRWGKPLTYDTLKEAKQVIPRAFGAYAVQFTPEGVVMKEITQAELEGLRLAEKARAALGARVGRAAKQAAGALVRGEAAAPIAFLLPREFGQAMQTMARTFWTDDGARSLFGFLRGVNAVWRIHATVLRPGYHLRNGVGNLWNNYLAGVTNVADYALAGRIQRAALARQSFEVATPLGRMPVQQVLDIMRERRVIQSYARMELGGRSAGVATLREQLRGGTWKPWSPEFKGARVGRAIAGTVEENARIAHFLNRWRVLGDPDAAAASVKKYLFDYFELTPVERNVLREVFPFYTYTRKNVPLQFEQLLRQPGRFALLPKLRRAIEGEAPEREELPEYFERQGYIGLPAQTQAGGRLFGGISLPALDINKLRTDRPGVGLLQELMGMVTPALRVPIEQAMNQVLFSGRRIEGFRGETVPAPPAIRALLGWATQVPAVRNLLSALGVRQGPEGGVEVSARALHVMNSVPTVRDLLNLTDPENQRRALQAFSFLAGTTLAEEEQARRTALYQRRDMLTDLLRQTEARGVEVPTVAELGQDRRQRRGGLIFGGR